MQSLKMEWRWLVAAAIVLALAAGYVIPRFAAGSSVTTSATVPPALVAPNAGTSAMSPPTPVATQTDLAVYVCGAVKKPGVYHLAPGARVLDAIASAGGAATEADLDLINLAEPLSDAMKICVPRKGQALSDFGRDETAMSASASGMHHRGRSRHSSTGSRGSHKLQPGQTLDVNAASADQLVALPGVGPSLAQRIVDYRQQNGAFQTIDDLQNVPGIGPSKFDKLQPYVKL
jgi:competence protein ComEA